MYVISNKISNKVCNLPRKKVAQKFGIFLNFSKNCSMLTHRPMGENSSQLEFTEAGSGKIPHCPEGVAQA
jgi:hypothetical protein